MAKNATPLEQVLHLLPTLGQADLRRLERAVDEPERVTALKKRKQKPWPVKRNVTR
jgi:hypothetical protein